MLEAQGSGGAVLTVDIGSSSVRASLYGTDGAPVSSGVKLDYGFSYTSEGAATVDAEDLLGLFTRAVDTLLSQRSEEIIAVGVSVFWHSLLGLDDSNYPVTPIISWADRRAANCVQELTRIFDAEELHHRTGCPPHSSYWPAKLLWLKGSQEPAYTSARRWASPMDYIYLNLFGRFNAGMSMASATGLFDRNGLRWDSKVLEGLGLDESELAEVSDVPFEGLREEWACRWPRLAAVPWYPSVGDGACSNMGSGCLGRDRVALMVGTSGAMRVAWKAERAGVEPGLWCYRVDARRFVSGGALSDGGGLIGWVKKNFKVTREVELQAARMKPDSHGLTFLSLFSGERGPGWSDVSNGVIAGLSIATGPAEVLRAAMESVALRFALISEKMSGTSSEDARIVASGGGLINSSAWVGIMADTLGRTIEVPQVEEASSRGAALLALESLGYLGSGDGKFLPAGDARIVEPDAEAHEVYRKALIRHKDLYRAMIEDAPGKPG